MSIKVKYIYNMQAIPIKSFKNWNNWKIYFQNESKFLYQNDLFNELVKREETQSMSEEKKDGYYGNY